MKKQKVMSQIPKRFEILILTCLQYSLNISAYICSKRTGHHVVGDEKTSVTMVLNKILWLEINANTSSKERMPARHRSL